MLLAAPSGAHTEADTVAVPAGAEATVSFAPNHGCDGSPTVAVSVRVPVGGATGGDVEGWTTTAEPDGDGNTEVRWTGGVLPDDATGAFPVTFTAPSTVGELLTFPAVQECEDGQELAWIDGDPEGEYPAPRLLILAEGSTAATSIDEVPADAPGRDQLTEIVDVDGHDQTEGEDDTEAEAEEGSSDDAVTTEGEATDDGGTDDEAAATNVAVDDEDDGGSSAGLWIGVAVVAAAAVAGVVFLLRRNAA